MIETLDIFVTIWFYWLLPSLILGAIGITIISVKFVFRVESLNKYLKIGAILILQMFLSWIIGFGTLSYTKNQIRQELTEFINMPDITITVDNSAINDDFSAEILNGLRHLNQTDGNNDYTFKSDKVKLVLKSKSEEITLSLVRKTQTEYVIYWNKYEITTLNEIGRIQAKIFHKKIAEPNSLYIL
jgi:hypothetical protein